MPVFSLRGHHAAQALSPIAWAKFSSGGGDALNHNLGGTIAHDGTSLPEHLRSPRKALAFEDLAGKITF